MALPEILRGVVRGSLTPCNPFQLGSYSWHANGLAPTKAADAASLLGASVLLQALLKQHPDAMVPYAALTSAFCTIYTEFQGMDLGGQSVSDLAAKQATCLRTMLSHVRRWERQE
eukprot:10212127-Alexandrium_andersonii.AAC.1